MAWRLVRSLTVYIAQINAMAPRRDKASDGTIGDRAHQRSTSDHNPRVIAGLGRTPVVTAADITHDPGGGCDINVIAEALRTARDARIKYVIWNRRMFSSYATSRYPAWTWRPYTGSNSHIHHGHLSVVGDARADDSTAWPIGEEGSLVAVADIITWEIRPWVAGMVHAVGRLEQAAAREEARDVALKAVVDAIAARAQGATVDAGPIVEEIRAQGDAAVATVTTLQEKLAAAEARIAELERQIEHQGATDQARTAAAADPHTDEAEPTD